MANLAERVERPTLINLARDVVALKAAVAFLRSNRDVTRRGTFAPASIPATALQSPAAPGGIVLTASNFAVSASGGTVLTGTVTVPARMTGCMVSPLSSRVYAVNSTGATDFLSSRVEIGTVVGNAFPVKVSAGEAGLNPALGGTLLTGLVPGSSFEVRVWAKSSAADWAASAQNTAELFGSLGWFG